MKNKKIGWSSYEVIEYINPISDMEAYLYDHYAATLKKYSNESDLYAIKQFIAGRMASPRKINILRAVISDSFPQYQELADKILVLY